MVFSSNIFIFFFLPLTIWGYYFLGKKFQNIFLLFMSTLFFAWSQPHYLWIIILNICVNYLGAVVIDNITNKEIRKIVFVLDIIINIGILFYFKYFNFAVDSINKIFDSGFKIDTIILPIGISFFTFQGLSYVIDVYKKEVAAQKNILKVALYILLFPQLIAGPIVRYSDVEAEINKREVSLEDFSHGLERFIIGLGKKVILSDVLATMVDGIWQRGVEHNTVGIAWLGCIAYTLQIYFDFSGYSDMAIGLGRIFGFHFRENFDMPYISKSITEFWRRWHISLSTWFREYVYIPLGGNRKFVYRNLAIVFLLTGLWHGAAWNFVLWGVWHGAFILLERYLKKNKKFNTIKCAEWIKRIYTLLVVALGWVLFRAGSIGEAIAYIKTMFGVELGATPGFRIWWYLDRWNVLILIVAIICSTTIPQKIIDKIKKRVSDNMYFGLKKIALLGMFFFALMRIVSGTYSPFIYFQF